MEPVKADIVVVGAGPGGYTAAFYAADRGKKVILVEREERLGGVCLNYGCIPSKALLHATRMITETKSSEARGIRFGKPDVDLQKLREWKNSILEKLGKGIQTLARQRGVEVVKGSVCFEDSKTLRVKTDKGKTLITFDKVILAVGSKPALPPAFDIRNSRVMTSGEALELPEIPGNLLVVGGGYIGLELGTVYAALGSRVSLAEALETILFGVDADLSRLVMRKAREMFKEVRLKTNVVKMESARNQIKVTMEKEGQCTEEFYDRVLVAVGRVPGNDNLGLKSTRVEKNEKGYIEVNDKQQTHDPDIYAVGDITGGVLLAHRASRQARVAVDAILGKPATFENVVIPAVCFTDPEVAWCGLTEEESKKKGIEVQVAKFMWGASGKALTLDRPDGLTKLIIDPGTERILGVGIVGVGAGDLISEGVLAVEMGAKVNDLARTVHPHPTLSETLMEAAEVFYGTATHTVGKKKE